MARAEVSEGVQMATNAKITITDNLQNGLCTDPYVQANDTVTGRYAQLVISGTGTDQGPDSPTNTNGCVVTITYGSGVDANGNAGGVSKYINGRVLVLNMLYNGGYQINTSTTTLPIQYWPKSIAPAPTDGDGDGGQ
ncbi:MAG: pilin [Neisseriaceae bacterium]|nr:pilin [Neisseriaceae bacterium]